MADELRIEEESELYDLFANVLRNIRERYGYTESALAIEVASLKSSVRNRPWRSDFSFEGIDFDNILTCCAYLAQYAGCHSALVRSVCLELFESCPEFASLSDETDLEVVSVGGGPGSDLAGFCSALHRHRQQDAGCKVPTLHLAVVDLKAGWEVVFDEMMDTARSGDHGDFSSLLDAAGSVSHSYEECDLWATENIDEIATADVVLMTKVLSWVNVDKKRTILKNIFSSMKNGAFFLFIDIEECLARTEGKRNLMTVLYSAQDRNFSVLGNSRPGGNEYSTYEVCLLRKQKISFSSALSRKEWPMLPTGNQT